MSTTLHRVTSPQLMRAVRDLIEDCDPDDPPGPETLALEAGLQFGLPWASGPTAPAWLVAFADRSLRRAGLRSAS